MTAIALLVVAVACGSDGADPTASPKPSDGTQSTIVIKNFVFEPMTVSVRVGETITVRNDDEALHSVTEASSPPAFDTSPFENGERTFKVDKPGVFTFNCSVHSFMPPGRVEVTA